MLFIETRPFFGFKSHGEEESERARNYCYKLLAKQQEKFSSESKFQCGVVQKIIIFWKQGNR